VGLQRGAAPAHRLTLPDIHAEISEVRISSLSLLAFVASAGCFGSAPTLELGESASTGRIGRTKGVAGERDV
jgi:hypothetical protein